MPQLRASVEISDRYCSYCGQLNSTKKLSLQDYFGEFIISIVNYDSRFRYTIKDLLFKPESSLEISLAESACAMLIRFDFFER